MTFVNSIIEYVVILAILAAAMISLSGCASMPKASATTFPDKF